MSYAVHVVTSIDRAMVFCIWSLHWWWRQNLSDRSSLTFSIVLMITGLYIGEPWNTQFHIYELNLECGRGPAEILTHWSFAKYNIHYKWNTRYICSLSIKRFKHFCSQSNAPVSKVFLLARAPLFEAVVDRLKPTDGRAPTIGRVNKNIAMWKVSDISFRYHFTKNISI